MHILGHLTVRPQVPTRLERLEELARNLYWTWDSTALNLFAALDAEVWESSGRSPLQLLRSIAPERLAAAAVDQDYLAAYDSVLQEFDEYMSVPAAPGSYAYFCAEYGWHESLPLYSGGLGVLAGDHTKAASDLAVPLTAVGLWYGEGYFHQQVSADGQQQAVYAAKLPGDLPFEQVLNASGLPLRVTVPLFGRQVRLGAWRVAVGRISVYLLDSDIAENSAEDRLILQRLYGGDQRTRIAQEVILGIGGVRLLRQLDIDPDAWHMNEGHSAFMPLERCRELISQGLTFEQAHAAVAANTVFTVHTPVAAGNDAFDFELVGSCFAGYWHELDLDQAAFNDLARADHGWGDLFSMPALALRFSSARNGVSQLHGDTTRRMWAGLWPEVPVAEVPIGHITNGVHLSTWMAPELQQLVRGILPEGHRTAESNPKIWAGVNDIPDQEYWQVRREIKQRSLQYLRKRAVQQLERRFAAPGELRHAATLFDADALTIGFARRFATYKRATLIFSDLERLERLLHQPGRPVQLVFAGKAHPADLPGQEFISVIQQLSRDSRFEGRILFLEDYDIALGRVLTRGVDVWLNNPRRPLEASGTSGEKAAMNGVLNLSVLDGWWPEGFDGYNGWAFGWTAPYTDENVQQVDGFDTEQLYALLEEQVVPLYYSVDDAGIPAGWLQRSKAAIATIAPQFSAQRMVRDYVQQLYAPAAARALVMEASDFSAARDLAAWTAQLSAVWEQVKLRASVNGTAIEQGDSVSVTAELYGVPADLQARVELVCSPEADALQQNLQVVPLEEAADGNRWTVDFKPEITGNLVYGVRVYPLQPLLASQFNSGFLTWASDF